MFPERLTSLAHLTACLLGLGARAGAQHDHRGTEGPRVTLGAMGVLAASHLTPGALRADVTEGYLTQPMASVTARGLGGRLLLHAVLNAEGATLARGEINAGAYGEGYIDRRHPHTWVHELMAGTQHAGPEVAWSLFAGKGFVPFGTDDPMTRPMVKFPVNHHLAQVLERAQVVGALQWRGLAVEAARFGGDEPESPTDWPDRERLLDSWSARATWWPSRTLEVSASLAGVQSPEFASGEGLDHRKRAGSVRWGRAAGGARYLLLEAARTDEYSGSRRAFAFRSLLAEASWDVIGTTVSARVERSDRPEEERTRSAYRTIRPLLDFNVLGRSRWTIATLRAEGRTRRAGRLRAAPGVEASYAAPRALVRPTALDPVDLFGARRLWTLSASMRVHAGTMRPRMGRYGAAGVLPDSA